MTTTKKPDMKDIGSSSTVWWTLQILNLILIVVIQIFLNWLLNEPYPATGIIIFLILYWFMVDNTNEKVSLKNGVMLLNKINKKKRAIFEGENRKLIWEEIEKTVDLTEDIDSPLLEESYPTLDGEIIAKASVSAKPDFSGNTEKERSFKMLRYIFYSKEKKKEMLESFSKARMKEFFREKTTDHAIKKSKESLQKDDFKDLCEQLSLKIVECYGKDADLNKAGQNARDARFKADALKEIKEALEKAGYSEDKALEYAPFMIEGMNVSRDIFDFNITGLGDHDPEIVKALIRLKGKPRTKNSKK